ncbi:MAG TPA: TonB-dependent receptor [Casimicrobiaceae bacterium]|nr:TonB-dependent receptor [Casimicrobiaceae bacterium]
MERHGALLFLLVAFNAHAQFRPSDVPLPLDPVVVTASRSPQRLLDLVADVTVLDAEQIASGGLQGVVELLAHQPGVEIIRNGGPGATSGVFLRGANAAQTLVLIDGMRVASASSGAAALEAIPPDQIERIEILRGPASSLYGADAIGGVIQIFTKRGRTGFHANASASYGTYDTAAGSAGIAGGNATANGALNVAGRRSDGYNAIVNPANFSYDPDRDGYRDASVSAHGELRFAADHALSMQYFRNRLDNQFDAGDAFDDRTITTVTTWQAALEDRLTPAWKSRLSAGEGNDESVSKFATGDFPFATRQRQYAWQNDVMLPAGDLTLALERREERVDASAGFAVTSRDTNAVTGIYRLLAGEHAVQANLRHDDSSQFGGKTTGAFAWGYRFAPGWRVTASAGTAFRAPTFNDLYFPGFSNPALSPETSRNIEAGLYANGWQGALYWQAGALAYRNRVRDLIVFQCDANFNCLPNNVANATLEGVTLTADLLWEGTTLRASLDLQSPTDDDTGHLLPRRARRHGALSVSQPLGPAHVIVEVVASSARYDDAENLRRLGGYAIVNLALEWTIGTKTTLFVRGENVFDRDYALAADFSTGGARVFAGFRWSM